MHALFLFKVYLYICLLYCFWCSTHMGRTWSRMLVAVFVLAALQLSGITGENCPPESGERLLLVLWAFMHLVHSLVYKQRATYSVYMKDCIAFLTICFFD